MKYREEARSLVARMISHTGLDMDTKMKAAWVEAIAQEMEDIAQCALSEPEEIVECCEHGRSMDDFCHSCTMENAYEDAEVT